ncbi:hypothetical protein HNO89_003533 [Sporosarcina luteola]|nr:hypothetical protein [Sporosarcina luteola]
MKVRLSMVCLTFAYAFIAAVIGLKFASKYPTNPYNTISFEEPFVHLFSLGMVVVLFLPPFILAFFQHIVIRIISAFYQGIIAISFLVLIPAGIFKSNIWVIIIGIIGAILMIGSIVATIMAGTKKEIR